MGLRRALLLASLWRARTDEDLSWGSLEQQADDDFVPTLSASNVTAYLMMPYAHCIDCAEGTGSWCAGATALYEAAVEPAETICVGHTLEEWEAAVAAVLAKHDDPADVLFVPFWIRSDWMQSFAGPLKNGSTAVLVGGAANGVMMYPDLDYGPAPPANHSYDARLFMVGPNNYEGSYAQAREFCRITESEDTPCAKYRDHVSVRDGDTAETSEFPPRFAAWLALGINSSASKARGRQRSECA